MLKLTAALENLEVINEVVLDDELQALEAQIPMDELAATVAMHEMNHAEATVDNTIDMIDRIESLAATIEEFGICAAAMKAVDPTENLRNYIAIPAYSDLPINPEKNEIATEALEGAKATIVKIWQNLVKFFTDLMASVKNFIAKVIQNSGVLKKANDIVVTKYKTIKVDPKLWAAKKVSGYSAGKLSTWDTQTSAVAQKAEVGITKLMDTYNGLVNAGSYGKDGEDKLIAGLKAIAADLNKADALGIKIAEGAKLTDFSMTTTAPMEPSEVTLGEMFGSAAGASKQLNTNGNHLKGVMNMNAVASAASKTMDSLIKKIKKAISDADKADTVKINSDRALIADGKQVISICNRIMTTLASQTTKVARVCLTAASKGLFVKKEEKNEAKDDATVAFEAAQEAEVAATSALAAAKAALEADPENAELKTALEAAEAAVTDAKAAVETAQGGIKTDETDDKE